MTIKNSLIFKKLCKQGLAQVILQVLVTKVMINKPIQNSVMVITVEREDQKKSPFRILYL